MKPLTKTEVNATGFILGPDDRERVVALLEEREQAMKTCKHWEALLDVGGEYRDRVWTLSEYGVRNAWLSSKAKRDADALESRVTVLQGENNGLAQMESVLRRERDEARAALCRVEAERDGCKLAAENMRAHAQVMQARAEDAVAQVAALAALAPRAKRGKR